ncbi:Elongator complex protein 5 [Madurella mycetomatis]|uniref:Elongator complex protein 5 n=1 Tax=Madurella mycetomatis TaxID=100816 RepID=A0A175W3X3_9PEZI|nr:Elongator complex protein 5 [Madurella mycetomatis]
MAPSAQTHQRTHSLLLFQKLLSLRDNASPLTLILDSLEQSAGPLVREFMNSAKTSRAKVVFVSFATIKKPPKADIFMKGRGKPLNTLAAEIASHVASKDATAASQSNPSPPPPFLYLSNLLHDYSANKARIPHRRASPPGLLFRHHRPLHLARRSLPLRRSRPRPGPPANEYAPHPLTLLSHLATTVFRVSNLSHAAEARTAQRRSVQAPEFGLREGREGVLIGLRGQGENSFERGLVVEMEMRRRSGRAVVERFVLVERKGEAGENNRGMGVVLWDAHPAFREEAVDDGREGEEMPTTTFNVGLTEKQRKDREGVVLPYFDAQVEMGREDDFDEEEDEI